MIRIAICDDSPDFLRQAGELLAGWEHPADRKIVTESFQDGDALLTAHAKNPFHIILLDIVMPLLNGIEAAREIREKDKSVKIVFLTTSAEFAIESYSVKASNYLLKPVNPHALFDCLNELIGEIQRDEKSIVVKGTDSVHRILLSDIEYIEAQGKQVLFALSGGNTVEALDPFYAYEDKLLLEDGFFKCHRSYVVNVYKINTYTQKEITMRSGCRIPISRSCHKGFESAYFSLLFGKADDL